MLSLTSRAVVYGLLILIGLLSALPNLLPPQAASRLPDWYSGNTISLGLDLRGGSHLLLEADTASLIKDEYQNLATQLADRLHEAGIPASRPRMEEGQLVVAVQEAQRRDASDIARDISRDDGAGPQRFTVRHEGPRLLLRLTALWQEQLIDDALARSLEVVRRRLDESGLVEPSITRQGHSGILVQMPGVADPAEIRKLLGTTARMTFHWAASKSSERAAVFDIFDAGTASRYRLERAVALQGKHIRDARLTFQADTGEPVVSFRLDKEGADQFAELTRDNAGRVLAVVLDGRVITAPVIRSPISGGSGEISGAFTAAEAGELALLLRAGALPVPLQVIEERTVGPDLGSDAISMGLTTGLAGAALVVAFMLVLYGVWGLIACVGLAINIGMLFGILSLFGATLTLPGIAGIILTIGMAVDANILINERIREESRRGKSARMALKEGFDKAYSTILDANLATLIAVSLLFLFGSGPVRGFAVTIGIGLLTSLFTAISVTRLLMEWQVKGKRRQSLKIGGINALDRVSVRGVNVLRGRVVGLAVSAVLSVASILALFHPGLHYGVDFTGGTLIELRTPGLSAGELRATLEEHGFADAAIQDAGGPEQFLVRVPAAAEPDKTSTQVDDIMAAVRELRPDSEFAKVDMVGPRVSDGFADATILAILLAGGGMLMYLWIRFESHFALAATLTIALDLTKTIGFFVLAGVEFNLTAVTALLALIGYSVNDKVVVFDRIRENLRLTPDRPILELLNESISSTLTRTVFTSVTTFLALLPMGIAGGSAVSSFAQPMLFGVAIGTSSSIFVASPILYFLGRRRSARGLSQLRPSAEALRQERELMP
ncbi:protein translocase subunit SecD [Spongiibacter taiwanensis]|uniref:protein translocase subunit SecD n=1 Tax=Spongiibacter taiwanensis TaxID=1748242 RepID=UPI002034AED6|nr:protein translocase subunit SecD [Spongiibacter taiwanensis]USA42348.1 protein translocase subunit SecD [Spongiibacter taiwanensis]